MSTRSQTSVSVYHYSQHSVVTAVVTLYDERGRLLRSELVQSAVWEREGETPEEHMALCAEAARRFLYEAEGLVP